MGEVFLGWVFVLFISYVIGVVGRNRSKGSNKEKLGVEREVDWERGRVKEILSYNRVEKSFYLFWRI